ncbi:MAG: hypothetical protein CL569_04135 [Alphaproteobacteria bacterium]|nr:hypothetical protein [Alphaproteobacteria bacterium]|tara:strand:- start:1793 stop:2455 length:663 start_codon:yes stop_codon:yes gene_type:complete
MAMRPEDSTTPWRIQGDWWDLCNCGIGCPCLFGENPTLGYCEGVLTYIIREGHHGEVDLGGLTVIFVVHFEGELFEVNREYGVLIDERANEAQREALEIIFTGLSGSVFGAMRDLRKSLDGIEFVKIDASQDEEEWKVQVAGLIDGLGGPFRKFLVPDGEACRITNAPRPEVVPGIVTIGQAIRNVITGPFGRDWDWTGRSAKHIPFDLSGPDNFTWKNE